MPGIQQYNIKQLLNVTPAPSVITDFVLKDIKINLIILEKELESGKIVKWVYATNEDYDPKEIDLLEKIFDLYGKRWGIESSYRVKKQYLPKTTSKNYMIRLFYFMFSVLLYNLWILADIVIWFALFGIAEEDHLITSKYFGTVLYTIGPGG